MARQILAPLSAVANNPLRVEQRVHKVEDGVGGLVEESLRFPIWVEPVADGKTPMCQALTLARQALTDFLGHYPRCFPPLVVNITDGMATDGSPEALAAAVRSLSSTDGNVLLFNAHISSRQDRPVEFPEQETGLPDDYSRLLFRMSSVLPPRLLAAAQAEGFRAGAGARGFVFNADLVSVIRFLDIGTKVAQYVR